MTALDIQLTDRYTKESAEVFMSGLHALARLPIEQLIVDRRRGLLTAAYVTGYPGSPVGGFPDVLDEAFAVRTDLPLTHRMALNEEYAATAVMGTQLVATRPDAKFQGVIGMWYGKAPGVDRALDAMRHGSFAGAAQHGGVVCVVGDDPNAKSSTLPSSSAGVLSDLHIPVLYPGSPAEALDLGRHAVALSRVTGLWTALKIVADVADGTGSVHLDPDRVAPILPTIDGETYPHLPDGRLLTPRSLELEREIYEVRYPLSIEYARLNRLNRVTAGANDATIGIVASGITYAEVRAALRKLGLRTDAEIAAAGLRLFKMLMPLPFDAESVRNFARGLTEIIVVEEKNPNVETLIKDALYAQAERPVIVGKRDESGRPLFPGHGALVGDVIAAHLYARLSPRLGARLIAPAAKRERIRLEVERTPFYCSGCPHNRSTQVPAGTTVGVGIGCHSLVLLTGDERNGDLVGLTPMGNEGLQWVGMAPFVDTPHIVQNLGDGTYYHSGRLAVAAAVASGVDVTYKLLYNDAIGMTGGQRATGRTEVAMIVRQLLDVGVTRVLITTDDVDKYATTDLPMGVEVWPRTRLDEAHGVLAQERGVTVLLHDQHCAAEARRLRKQGLMKSPTERVVINHRLCEGCGHCGEISNCLSVQPFETEYGRKTRIDQTTCNFDYSCIEGDCPSFTIIETKAKHWRRRKESGRSLSTPPHVESSSLPVPRPEVDQNEFNLRITGVGGTGVVTVSQVLGTAAMLDGYEVRGLDQIGLSQKAGPVVSDLRLTRVPQESASRIGSFEADVLLALDQLVAASAQGLDAISASTIVVGSSSFTPTGAMVANPEMSAPSPVALAARISAVSRADRQTWADAALITTRLLGNAVTANVFVLGMAVQSGAVPVAVERIEEALRLNGAAVEANLRAFTLGRLAVADPARLEQMLESSRSSAPIAGPAWLTAAVDALRLSAGERAVVSRNAVDLIDYANDDYARRYLAVVEQAIETDAKLNAESRFTHHVIRQTHKLMAYKDEYEVARLMLHDDARAEGRRVAGERGRVSMLLHPPFLRAIGIKRKIRFPEWLLPLFAVLAWGKILRGTPLDVFGYTAVRRAERRLRDEYLGRMQEIGAHPARFGLSVAVRLAELPDLVRGYEHIKMRCVADYDEQVRNTLAGIEVAR